MVADPRYACAVRAARSVTGSGTVVTRRYNDDGLGGLAEVYELDSSATIQSLVDLHAAVTRRMGDAFELAGIGCRRGHIVVSYFRAARRGGSGCKRSLTAARATDAEVGVSPMVDDKKRARFGCGVTPKIAPAGVVRQSVGLLSSRLPAAVRADVAQCAARIDAVRRVAIHDDATHRAASSPVQRADVNIRVLPCSRMEGLVASIVFRNGSDVDMAEFIRALPAARDGIVESTTAGEGGHGIRPATLAVRLTLCTWLASTRLS